MLISKQEYSVMLSCNFRPNLVSNVSSMMVKGVLYVFGIGIAYQESTVASFEDRAIRQSKLSQNVDAR